jgi:hypothetical protein
MAKHAKRRKKTHSRRRRMSGGLALNASSDLVKYGSIAAGYLLGDKINAQIDKAIDPTKIDQKLEGAVQAGAGAAYMFLKKGKKNMILTVASGVMLGSGAKRALKAFGIGALPINAYQNMPHVNGIPRRKALSGYQDLNHVGAHNPSGSGMGFNAQRIPINGNATIFRNRMRA